LGKLPIRYFSALFLLLALSSYASNIPQKFSTLLTQIKNAKQLLFKHQSQQTNLQESLARIELAINNRIFKIGQIQIALREKNTILKNLTTQEQKLKQRIQKQRLLLLRQIRTSYLLGLNKNKLQLILSSKDPEQINRLLSYNYYLVTQNTSLIESLKTDIAALNRHQAEIAKRTSYLESLKQKQLAEQRGLDANKTAQQALLTKINAQIKSQAQRLQELIQNKSNLEKIIAKLQTKQSFLAHFMPNVSGHFPWPTRGKVIETFGSIIQNSELKQNGVLIAAPEGQKVFAVAPGKVIFANWMPGYGLLLIIDHGKGYMTLYGNNGVLYKQKNDRVAAHELIATVGHTGGQQRSALYFALRNNGKPINPKTWCQ
jgi:murein hydrolase activator